MDVGMLWFDDDPNSDFLSKVNKAANYYRSKYGEIPDMCFVHPSMLENLTVDTSTIKINTNGSMLRHHFWIGVQNKETIQP